MWDDEIVQNVSELHTNDSKEGRDDQAWLIVDEWAAEWILTSPKYDEANINQKWPCAFEGISPTTSVRHKRTTQSMNAVGKPVSQQLLESPVMVHLRSAKCYPNIFQRWADCSNQRVAADNSGWLTTPPFGRSFEPGESLLFLLG